MLFIQFIKLQSENIEKNKDNDIIDICFYTLQYCKNNKVNDNNYRTTNEMRQNDIQINKKQINQQKSRNP